jgi:hypothetical protein
MTSGLRCANYFSKRGTFPECEGAWCPSCYTVALEDDVFPIKRAVSLEDEDAVVDAKDNERFVVARAGDHLMVQFQCDVCHFRNIQRRSPEPGSIWD